MRCQMKKMVTKVDMDINPYRTTKGLSNSIDAILMLLIKHHHHLLLPHVVVHRATTT
jgi:hypothetical protein